MFVGVMVHPYAGSVVNDITSNHRYSSSSRGLAYTTIFRVLQWTTEQLYIYIL